jgi:hypothetical protein
MGWLTALLGILSELVKAIPILDRWFTKTPSEKGQDSKDDVRKDVDDFKGDGRPPR